MWRMICPNDNTAMKQVKVESHYGQTIIVDQCGICGGIWFDESELLRARQGEAEKIEPLNAEILVEPSAITVPHVCPKDGTQLFRFRDKHFPDSIVLERCPNCHGMWLNRGEFTRYQKARLVSLQNRNTDDKSFGDSVSKMTVPYQAGRSTVVLGKLGNFLSTDMNTPASAEQGAAAENTAQAALGIVITLLRLFLRI